jgi:dienelactone hydrolase
MKEKIEVKIPVDGIQLPGMLTFPEHARGVVIFAHGSGSSRFSKRNVWVAEYLQRHGFGTLLFDLLTADEESVDIYTRQFRFDIPLLAKRLVTATKWIWRQEVAASMPTGYFGASTGAAAALIAAADLGDQIGAVVSRGGRPDLAGTSLKNVLSPVLLIVGGSDEPVIELNREAYNLLRCEKEVRVVPGATHLFEEPGTLERVADLAVDWYDKHLTRQFTYSATNRSIQTAVREV